MGGGEQGTSNHPSIRSKKVRSRKKRGNWSLLSDFWRVESNKERGRNGKKKVFDCRKIPLTICTSYCIYRIVLSYRLQFVYCSPKKERFDLEKKTRFGLFSCRDLLRCFFFTSPPWIPGTLIEDSFRRSSSSQSVTMNLPNNKRKRAQYILS